MNQTNPFYVKLSAANPPAGPNLPNELDKSYNCKFIVTSFLIVLFFFLFNNAYAATVVLPRLTTQITTKIRQYPKLLCGVYIKPSWLPGEISINGDTAFPAASLIKIPIAVALLKEIDKGTVSWDKTLILKRYHYASGAGYLRTKKTGTKVKLKEAFKLMLTISDNTASNMIIDLLGGIIITNEKISKLGLKNTKLVSLLGDFKGTNKTSPHDLANLLEKSLEGNILRDESRKILKKTLLAVNNKSLIKKGLGRYTKFAHKTGTIGICVGDAGIVYLPWGKRIAISIIVRRPFNSLMGQKVIREISKLVYQHLG